MFKLRPINKSPNEIMVKSASLKNYTEKCLLTNKQTLTLKILDVRPLKGIIGVSKLKFFGSKPQNRWPGGFFFKSRSLGEERRRLSAEHRARERERERNKIATFAVMYHVHVNSFPVWSYAAVAIEAALHSGRKSPNLLSICFAIV